MFSKIRDLVLTHISNNKSSYFFLFMTFIAGVSAGAFTVNGLSTIQKDDLTTYLQGFLRLMDNYNVNSTELLSVSLQENFKQVAMLWILGVTIVGIPLIYILTGIRGFITGFSSGYIINATGLKGILFTSLTVLPKEFIIVPCLIAIGVNGINFSMKIIRKKSPGPGLPNKETLKSNLLSYCFVTGFFSLFIVVAGLMEAYVIPVFVRMLAPAILNG